MMCNKHVEEIVFIGKRLKKVLKMLALFKGGTLCWEVSLSDKMVNGYFGHAFIC